MATIYRYFSPAIDQRGDVEVIFRISLQRNKKYRIKTGVRFPSKQIRDGELVWPRANQKLIQRMREADNSLTELERRILDKVADVGVQDVDRSMIEMVIDQYHHPERYGLQEEEPQRATFFDLYNEFLDSKDISKNRADIYRSLERVLHRYEMHRRQTREPEWVMDVDGFTAEDVSDVERFYRDEWKLYDEFPEIYTAYPVEMRTQYKTHKPQKRGHNVVVCMMKKLRTFFNWCYTQGLTGNRPFDRYTGNKSERYGTPYYLTKEERDALASADLTKWPGLEAQRDIFIFQCHVGCRVSDLMKLRATNVVGGAIEYVAGKTKKERATTIRVPLSSKAKEIVERYAGREDGRLLPFISSQRYNDAIKEMCKRAGLDRVVTVINPTTGEDERKAIWEVASSHMARRTFCGILYKQVKDPNLVGALSGHKEGSKAFARYRDIDEDMRKGLIDLLE